MSLTAYFKGQTQALGAIPKGVTMLIVKTLNSTYTIQATGEYFKVTKVDQTNSETKYLQKGESRLHKMIALEVGKRGYFDTVVTTTVQSVKENT